MQYTKYFALITKEQGTLNLSSDQFRRMMNIVHLEGALYGLNKIKDSLKNTNQFNKYDMLIFEENNRLIQLTSNLTLAKLVEELIQLSLDF